MKQKYLQSILSLALFVGAALVTQAQTIDTILGCDELPLPGSNPACTICNFDLIYGSTLPFTPSPNAGWCGTIENDQYIGFTAGATGVVQFQIDAFNCWNGDGLQVAIYDQGNNLVSDCIRQLFPQSTEALAAGGLTPGETYYLRVDGFAGDLCEFYIQAISGLSSQPADPITSLFGPQQICPGTAFTYFSDPSPNTTQYVWSFSWGNEIDTVEVVGHSNTTEIVTTSPSLEIIVPADGHQLMPGECETLTINISPRNECFDTQDTTSRQVLVCVPATIDTVQVSGTYAHCESGYLYPGDGNTYSEGVYYFGSVDTSCNIIELNVSQIGDSITFTNSYARIVCAQNPTTDIEVTINGGIPPFTISWEGVTNTQTTRTTVLAGVEAGNYLLNVTDSLGCQMGVVFVIRDESDFTIPFSVTPADCDGENGKIRLQLVGNSHLQGIWTTGDTTSQLIGLPVGNYGLTLLDTISGCSLDTIINVGIDSACFSLVSGYVTLDEQTSCVSPDDHFPLANVQVTCSNGATTFTDQDGYYEFRLDVGTYTFSVGNTNIPNATVECSPPSLTIPSLQNNYPNNDFYLTAPDLVDIALHLNKGVPIVGRIHSVYLTTCNNGTLPYEPTVNFVLPPNQELIAAGTPQPVRNGDTLVYTLPTLTPGQCITTRLRLRTSTTAMLGDTVFYHAFTAQTITDVDTHPDDNTLDCTDLVRASYDPNDKAVIPAGTGPQGVISLEDTLLQYTIRFENEGNADAIYVRLEDQISSNLDIRTLRPIAASDPYEVYYNEDGRLFVEFNDIVLTPRSVDSVASQGFFTFTIETIPGLEPLDVIENTAEIYFDFNPPIITNTVVNTIEQLVAVNEVERPTDFLVYPNPVKQQLTLELNSNERIKSIELRAIDGRRIANAPVVQDGNTCRIDLGTYRMPEGTYLLEVELFTGEVLRKSFVKY